MPLSERDLLEVQSIARAYSDAEARILLRLTASLAAGIDAPEWETRALGRVQRLRAEAVNELRTASAGAAAIIEARLDGLYSTSGREILRDVGDSIPEVEIATGTKRNAVRRIATELASSMDTAGTALLRRTDDVYREVIGRVVSDVTAGGMSKRDALSSAVKNLLGRGLPAFEDSAGRKWRIQDYANMAVRTGYAAAQIQGHEDALDAAGLDLVIVQPGPRACPICDKWARLVLARSGETGTQIVDSYATGSKMLVQVDATLAEARAAGFQHPNCRCSLRAFIPGVTKRADIARPPFDAEGYERQQQQRGLERKVREAKIAVATAQASNDPKALARAQARLKARQDALSAHLKANPYLKRRRDREQVLRGYDGGTPATPTTPRPTPAPTPPAPETERLRNVAMIEQHEAEDDDRPFLERPPGEVELMARFRRLEQTETVDEIVTKSNPGGDDRWNRDYLMNCHYVVAAVEMRARGYDVVARPTVANLGRFDRQIEDDYRGDRKFTYLKDAPKQANGLRVGGGSALDWIERETAAMPIGARGYVTGAWARGGGGHIWSWEKTASGIVYHEGQIREHGSDKARANVLNLKSDTLGIMRVDDLEPAPGIVSAMQSPDEFKASGPDVLRDEIARIDERIATLEATLPGQIAEADEYREYIDTYERYQTLVKWSKDRKRSMTERYSYVEEANALARRVRDERAAFTTGVNRETIVRGTKNHITKWKTERNRLKRKLKELGY